MNIPVSADESLPDFASLYALLPEPATWDTATLFRAPDVFPATDMENELNPPPGLHGIYLSGLEYQGRPTRIFAWVGIPDHPADSRLPAMVLVHGGGGTAFAEWVRLWNERGYAAIAMDTAGAVPTTLTTVQNAGRRHAWAGPEGWGGYARIEEPETDQWPHHAVASVIIAHSHLRSLPEIDASRIGLVGISWGGFLTSHVAAVDSRFRCAIAVYGCGFYGYSEGISEELLKPGRAKAEAWIRKWDPAHGLERIQIPTLWVNGPNDPFFSLLSLTKTCQRLSATHTLSILDGFVHSHPDGFMPEEIAAFADAHLRNGDPLPKVVTDPGPEGTFHISWTSPHPVVQVIFYFTCDADDFRERKWQSRTVPFRSEETSVRTDIPTNATFCYFDLTDDRGLHVSSELRPTSRRILSKSSADDDAEHSPDCT